jgi:hypothetical protein
MSERRGCIILLLDESGAMESPVIDDNEPAAGQPRKSKGASVATAVNALLRQLSTGPDCDVALVGYRTDESGAAVADCRWGGSLAGREFVKASELAAAPVVVEERKRRIPDPASLSGFREEAVSFPVWYVPQAAGTAPQVRGFQFCRELAERWLGQTGAEAGAPVVLHVFAAASSDGNPIKAIDEIRNLPVSEGKPAVFQAHMCVSKTVPCNAYATNRLYVPAGAMRDLFDRCSELTGALIESLKAAKVPATPNSRGFAYNARMSDVSKFLGLAKGYVASLAAPAAAAPKSAMTPPAPPRPGMLTGAPPPHVPAAAAPPAAPASSPAAPTAEPAPAAAEWAGNDEIELLEPEPVVETPTAQAGLVLFLIDRSAADPYGGDTQNACGRLVKQVNELLSKLSKKAEGRIETGVVSYGCDLMGETDVRTTFEGGPLAGRALVRDAELADGALRIDEIEEQRSDGVGGIQTITVRQATYVELDASKAVPPAPAFTAAAGLVSEWSGRSNGAGARPVVVHLTRAQQSVAELQEAVAQLPPETLLYHVVATEDPHPSVLYPNSPDALQDANCQVIWSLTSPLEAAAMLAETRPQIQPDSRGLVVNGKFDLLLDSVKAALAPV